MARSTLWKTILIGAGLAGSVGLLGYAVLGHKPRAPEFRAAWESPGEQLTHVLYSHDGEYLAAGGATGEVVVWPLSTSKPRLLAQLTKQPITAIALSPDGVLGAGDAKSDFFSWKLGSWQTQSMPRLAAPAACIAFQPSRLLGPGIVLGLSDGSLVTVGKAGVNAGGSGHTGGVKTAAYSPDGKVLITGGTDGTLIWRDGSGRAIDRPMAAHASEVSALVFSRSGKLAASADWNGEIRVWDTTQRKKTESLTQPDAVSAMAWIQDDLVTGSWDGRLRFWSLGHDAPHHTIDTGGVIHGLAVSPSGETIATVSNCPHVDLWRVPTD